MYIIETLQNILKCYSNIIIILKNIFKFRNLFINFVLILINIKNILENMFHIGNILINIPILLMWLSIFVLIFGGKQKISMFKIFLLIIFNVNSSVIKFYIKKYRCIKETCAICLEYIQEDMLILYYCNHCFHQSCFENWGKECPMCRKPTLGCKLREIIYNV